jgi:apolipoprotein N-acyltransferase
MSGAVLEQGLGSAERPSAPLATFHPHLAVGASVSSAILLLLSLPVTNLWPLAWVALVPLLWAVSSASSHRRGFLHGFVMGLVLHVGGMSWLLGAIGDLLQISRALALPIFLALCASHALLFGAFAVCLRIMRARTGLPFALVAPVTLVAIEAVMPKALPSHLAIFQAWVLPVIQVAEITGPLGITFCLAMVSGALFDALSAWADRRPLPRRPLAFALSLMTFVVAFGFVRMAQMDARWALAPKVRVGVVQPNIGIHDKPRVDRGGRMGSTALARTNAQKLLAGSLSLEAAGAALVVWPETAYPQVVSREAGSISGAHTRLHVPLLTGAMTRDKQDRRFNSALLITPKGRAPQSYDKNVLFPLGEGVPLARTFPVLARLLPKGGDAIEAGHEAGTLDLADPRAPGGAFKLGPLVCLEDTLPGLAGRAGRLGVHALVTVANDAWFGPSGSWDHLALAVLRSVEQRTAMVRASQNGVSALIDATGRVRGRIPPAAPSATTAETRVFDVAMLEGGHTVYATLGSLWGFADLLGLVTLVLLGAALVSAARHRLQNHVSGSRRVRG